MQGDEVSAAGVRYMGSHRGKSAALYLRPAAPSSWPITAWPRNSACGWV